MSELAGAKVEDYMETVDKLPDGFTVVHRKSRLGRVDIHCAKCGVSAV